MRLRIAACAAVLLASAYAGAAPSFVGFAGGAFIQGPSGTAITDIVGLSTSAADTALEADGFDTGTVTTRCSSEDENTVLSQSPAAGTSAAAGTTVDLVASNGTPCTRGRSGVRLRGLRLPGL